MHGEPPGTRGPVLSCPVPLKSTSTATQPRGEQPLGWGTSGLDVLPSPGHHGSSPPASPRDQGDTDELWVSILKKGGLPPSFPIADPASEAPLLGVWRLLQSGKAAGSSALTRTVPFHNASSPAGRLEPEPGRHSSTPGPCSTGASSPDPCSHRLVVPWGAGAQCVRGGHGDMEAPCG